MDWAYKQAQELLNSGRTRAEVERVARALRDEREACAKIADQHGTNAERRAASHDNGSARNAALDKLEAAINIAMAIRERTQPQ